MLCVLDPVSGAAQAAVRTLQDVGMESRLDHVYRSLLLTKFFTRGWGSTDTLTKIIRLRKILGDRGAAAKVLEEGRTEVTITKEEVGPEVTLLDGQFTSPLAARLPELCRPPVATSHFQAVLPRAWAAGGARRPMVLQFAGTGDHYYWRRRRLMALPMARERGIGSILLENPYYGLRRPRGQLRSSLHHVSDLFVMGAALIMEAHVLLSWAEREGCWPLACHGISMGGHMATLAASAWPKPVALVPCLAWTSGSVTFCQGVMAGAIDWRLLANQLVDTGDLREEVWRLVDSPEFDSQKKFLPRPDFRARPLEGGGAGELGPALEFMRGLMDECTHLGNYTPPIDPDLVELVVAAYDAYQPRHGVTPLHEVLGCRPPRVVPEGHIRAYLFHQHEFRAAIYDALDRTAAKYPARCD